MFFPIPNVQNNYPLFLNLSLYDYNTDIINRHMNIYYTNSGTKKKWRCDNLSVLLFII